MKEGLSSGGTHTIQNTDVVYYNCIPKHILLSNVSPRNSIKIATQMKELEIAVCPCHLSNKSTVLTIHLSQQQHKHLAPGRVRERTLWAKSSDGHPVS